MLKPLKQWICDECQQVIEKPEDGYVFWKSNDEFRPHSFKIIHQIRCYNDKYDRYDNSLPVTELLGIDGMQWFLSMLSNGVLRNNTGETNIRPPVDLNSFVDFFRRLQTPNYEEARTKFRDPEVLEYDDYGLVTPYRQENLKKIIS